MEDVFDTTGRPPKGWMHAIFHGGPYGEDVGRCIPGPPAPEIFTVPLAEGGVHTYRLWTVGSWSDPEDPIAVYNPDGPPVPPPLLTAQEKKWIREGRQPDGLVRVRLDAQVTRGRWEWDPDVPTIEAMLTGLRHREHLLLQRLTDQYESDWYIQVLLDEDDTYEVVHQAGTAADREVTRSASQAAVRDAVLRWAAEQPTWRTALEWPKRGDGS
ncbi:hypothetical protein [Streptomyces venezuelae]|uniref:hypothetical protein n=1 Tax=Streptomyces venezuelae TaxID=54571 RepID=UPI00278C0A93|nr:hypothetical protein [Streptomyces venezuelae]